MALRTLLKSAIAVAFLTWPAPQQVYAAGADRLKGEIETYLKRFGQPQWEGADKFDVRDEGDAAVAVIVNGRFSLRKDPAEPKPTARITFDRLEIRRKPADSGDGKVEFVVTGPPHTTLTASDGTAFTLALTDATTDAIVDEPGDRYRSVDSSFAAARIERTGAKDWVTFGPMKAAGKVTATADGGWVSPQEFEVKAIEFLFADAPLAGTIDKFAATAEASGPSLAALEALRDEMAALRDKDGDPTAKMDAWAAVLPKIAEAFAQSKGEFTVEGTTVKRPAGDTLVSLAKATMAGSITGLGSDSAALRFTVGHEGLAIAPALVPEPQVPRRVSLDFGIEDIAGAPLRTILNSAHQFRPGASDAEKQAVLPSIIVAAMALKPVLRLYSLTAEFKDARIDASGEAKRAPPLPLGYAAMADVAVRGFEALSGILTDRGAREHLALLRFIGTPDTAADGTKITKFHLASETGKPLTVNGDDLSLWLSSARPPAPAPGSAPRPLLLADPPLTGDDVRAVQKKVMEDGRADGVYDGPTALAVARFQRRSGINVSGVVDGPTRDKLGLAPPPKPKN